MGRKKTDITPDELEQLAREGMGRAQIAKHYGLSYTGFVSRLEREPELREAYDFGAKLHREDLYGKMLLDFQDPGTKANVRAQLFDKMSRWGDIDRTKELQTAVLGNLSDDELVALNETMQRRQLEDRLRVTTRGHEDEDGEKVAVTEPVPPHSPESK